MRPKAVDLIRLNKVPAVVLEMTNMVRCRATVYSWVKNGRSDLHGSIVKLKTTKKRERLYTTRNWLLEFMRAVG